MNHWLLIAAPDKWFGEQNQNNYKVNEVLLHLDEQPWRIKKKHFKNVSIDRKSVV